MQETFVARGPELQQLDRFLEQALHGQGGICFICGEAGTGKSALTAAFAHRAQERYPELIGATGVCDAVTGVGSPYLPMREVLSLLLGDVEGRLAQGAISAENAKRLKNLVVVSSEILLEHGPDLIGLFLPGATLLAKIGKTVAEKAKLTNRLRQRLEPPPNATRPSQTGLDQAQIFEQCASVLCELAKHQPLLLLLDDLHWADTASLELLFHLGRRLAGSRVLVVGTYRPEEVALGRAGQPHPLKKVLAEFKRYAGDIWIDLDQTTAARGREFVAVLLDSVPNRLDELFHCALLAHTGGHPLFTVELLRHLQEQGALVKAKDGCWVQRGAIDWNLLPARVEGVIEERLARLATDLRQCLTVASVEGEQFTAEVLARVRSQEVRSLVQQLSGELEKEHRLVASLGVQRLAAQRLSRYRFSHNLVQTYLYSHLDAVELSYLHDDVGHTLEALYGDRADTIAPQLARHFELANLPDKACHYLRRAGEQAAATFANVEALDYLSRALALTPITDLAGRFALLLAREQVHALLGARDMQAQDLAALDAVADDLADPARRALVALRHAAYGEVTGDYPSAIAHAQQAVTYGHCAGVVESEAQGFLRWGASLWRQAEYAAAAAQNEQGLALARQAGLPRIEAEALRGLGIVVYYQGDTPRAQVYLEQSLSLYRTMQDPRGESKSLNSLGVIAYQQSEFSAARAFLDQSLHLKRKFGDRHGQGVGLTNLGNIAVLQNDWAAAHAYFEQCLRLCYEIDNREGISSALAGLGTIALQRGDIFAAQTQYAQALDIAREIGDREEVVATLAGLGGTTLHLGDTSTAQAKLDEALSLAREIGDRRGEGGILELLARLSQCAGNADAARAFSQQALAIAQEIRDLSQQGDALTSLGHVLLEQGHYNQAAAAYQCTLELRRQLGQPDWAVTPLAGMAQSALCQGDMVQAQAHADALLASLVTQTLGSVDESFVHLALYQVLQATGDARAFSVLERAHERLQARSVTLPNEAMRRSFLENVPCHRALVAAWQQSSPG